jgi:NAD(P)H-quinone oxidoreductase subunit 5
MNFTKPCSIGTVSPVLDFAIDAMTMILPDMPPWQVALTLAPAAAAALAALLSTVTPTATAWRLARWGSTLALAAAVLALAAVAAGTPGAAFAFRADLVGGVLTLLVTFIGWVIVRYSQTYLAGEPGERSYVTWLLATLTAVLLVAVSNHLVLLVLAWTGTSLALHRLLTFFRGRPAALMAAHKKFIVGRAADLSMLVAAGLLWQAFGTLQIDALLARAQSAQALPLPAQAAVVLIALAALLKCAQLPFHGWLIQVMEAPTPVSALLHAGVVNLGGFVLIRFAPLVAESTAAQALLVASGTFTAIVAALVMTTRISIKVQLAWSTTAQMGFMLMQCALGLWEMALLHLVAHSLYKAHAFLSAGSTVRQTLLRQMDAHGGAVGVPAMLAGAAIGAALTAAAALLWSMLPFGAGTLPPALIVSACILALALTPLAHTSLRAAGGRTWLRAVAASFGIALVYFALHAALTGWVAPAAALPATAWWLLVATAFALLFVLQCALTAHPDGALARRLYPWFYGGLYLDERFSRVVLRLWPPPAPAPDADLSTLQPAAPGAR